MSYSGEARIGIHNIAKILAEELNWIFREQPSEDFGIDGQIEIVNACDLLPQNAIPSGRLIAAQIKSGHSYFKEENRSCFVYRGEKRHASYWLKYSLPVIIIIYDRASGLAYWEEIKTSSIKFTEKGFKLNIPKRNVLAKESKYVLEKIACANQEHQDYLQAHKDAKIILELERIKGKYHDGNWKKRQKYLEKLGRYTFHAGQNACHAILEFLYLASDSVRIGIPRSIIYEITSLSSQVFPYCYQATDQNEILESGKMCIAIGNDVAYDAVIYLDKLSYLPHAFTLWKHVYTVARRFANYPLMEAVLCAYKDLESHFERNTKDQAIALLRVFKDDIEYGSLAFPPYPEDLLERVKLEGGHF